jgi:predicted  nucleic acid-binding Zn-ribbon protein
VFTVLNILVGDSKSLGTNRIESVLNLLGETDYIESNEIVIKDFLEEFTTQHVTVESVEVENKYLVFEITPDQETTSLLQDLQNEIQNALEDVFTNPQYSNLESTYQDFINNQATLNDLIDTMNDLSPNVQQQLFEDLQNLLGDYSDLIPNL